MGKKPLILIILALTLGFLVPHSVLAQTYDGLWMSPLDPNSFGMLIEDGNLLLGIIFDFKGEYLVFFGPLSEGTAQVQNVYPSTFNAAVTVTFASPTDATFMIDSCTGDCTSLGFPSGVAIPLSKPWPVAK